MLMRYKKNWLTQFSKNVGSVEKNVCGNEKLVNHVFESVKCV